MFILLRMKRMRNVENNASAGNSDSESVLSGNYITTNESPVISLGVTSFPKILFVYLNTSETFYISHPNTNKLVAITGEETRNTNSPYYNITWNLNTTLSIQISYNSYYSISQITSGDKINWTILT